MIIIMEKQALNKKKITVLKNNPRFANRKNTIRKT